MTQIQGKFERLNSRAEMEFQFDDYHQKQQEYLVSMVSNINLKIFFNNFNFKYNVCKSLNSNSREDELIIVHYTSEELDIEAVLNERLNLTLIG